MKKRLFAVITTCILCASMIAQPAFAAAPKAAKAPAKPTTTAPTLTKEETAEKNRIMGLINAQVAVAKAEQDEYALSGNTPTVKIDINTSLQSPELPNGCEVTALCNLLTTKFLYIPKTLVADNYLPTKDFEKTPNKFRMCADPNEFYCGDPYRSSDAYYCFEDPIIKAGNEVIAFFKSDVKLEKLDKPTESDLISQLDKGNAVMAWTTLSNGEAYKFSPYGWINFKTGIWTDPYLNLHTVVLTGYDDDYFYMSDSIRGDVVAKRSAFMSSFEQLGSRAIIAA